MKIVMNRHAQPNEIMSTMGEWQYVAHLKSP